MEKTSPCQTVFFVERSRCVLKQEGQRNSSMASLTCSKLGHTTELLYVSAGMHASCLR